MAGQMYPYIALHDFAAPGTELSFKKGDLLQVRDPESEKNGWFWGHVPDGRKGWIPANRAKPCQSSEEARVVRVLLNAPIAAGESLYLVSYAWWRAWKTGKAARRCWPCVRVRPSSPSVWSLLNRFARGFKTLGIHPPSRPYL